MDQIPRRDQSLTGGLEKTTRRNATASAESFERTPLEDAVRCWLTRKDRNLFQKTPPRTSCPSKPTAALKDSFPGNNRWRQLKPKRRGSSSLSSPRAGLDPQQLRGLVLLSVFPITHWRGPSNSWWIWWGRALLQQGRAGGAQRAPGKHQPPPQGATESSVRRSPSANPISQADVAQNPRGSQVTPSTYAGAASGPGCLLGEGAWKIASGPGQRVSLTQEELQQLSQGSLSSPSMPEPRAAATVGGGVTSCHLPSCVPSADPRTPLTSCTADSARGAEPSPEVLRAHSHPLLSSGKSNPPGTSQTPAATCAPSFGPCAI